MPKEKIAVLIPAYNEEKTLGKVLGDLQRIKEKGVIHEVIVVNDGSQDHTAEVARNFKGTRVLSLPENRGKGSAFYTGALEARKRNASVLVMLDADLKRVSLNQIKKLVKPLRNPGIKMVVGTQTTCSPFFSGHRAIRMKALHPLFIGKYDWLHDIAGIGKSNAKRALKDTRIGLGLESALNWHLGGKEFFFRGNSQTAHNQRGIPTPHVAVVDAKFDTGPTYNLRPGAELTRAERTIREPFGMDLKLKKRFRELDELREARKRAKELKIKNSEARKRI